MGMPQGALRYPASLLEFEVLTGQLASLRRMQENLRTALGLPQSLAEGYDFEIRSEGGHLKYFGSRRII